MLAGSDELVKADRMMCRFVAEAIQASKKALFATAAKETVAIQDQGLSLERPQPRRRRTAQASSPALPELLARPEYD